MLDVGGLSPESSSSFEPTNEQGTDDEAAEIAQPGEAEGEDLTAGDAMRDGKQAPMPLEGDIVAEGDDKAASDIPGLFDDDDFNIDELVKEEVQAGKISRCSTRICCHWSTCSWVTYTLHDVDVDVEDVLEQIGFRSFSDRKGESVEEEERMFEYPEPPERSIKFGALLKKCGYAEDVIEQYTEVADIEVRSVARATSTASRAHR